MNDKKIRIANKIMNAIDDIWQKYYAEEGIKYDIVATQDMLNYDRLVREIADVIYKVGERHRVQQIVDLGSFEERMKEIYPMLVEIVDEEVIDYGIGKRERYTAWLKFPYYSTDSNGGFFTFYTEKEFAQYMTSSIRMFTEDEIKNEKYEPCQYGEFFDDDHRAIFNCDKALYLFYKARLEMEKCLLKNGTKVIMHDGRVGVIDDNDFINSDTFNDVNYYVYPIGDNTNYEMYLAADIVLFNEE